MTGKINNINRQQANAMLEIQQLVGPNYRILNHLKSGSSSDIYAATTGKSSFPLVVKVFRQTPSKTISQLGRMQERASICLTMRHPCLISVLDIIEDRYGNSAAIVMERVQGKTLFEHTVNKQDDLTIGSLTEIFFHLAEGIDAIHRRNIIHRDIKPGNILIDDVTGRPKIGDFGLALGFTEVGTEDELDTFGTPAYIAPEQIIGTNYGPEADIYSLAITIYTILSRSPIFDVLTTRDLLMAHIHQEPVPLRRRNRSWPKDLESALLRSLNKDRRKRHPSARALAEEVSYALKPFTPFRLSTYFDGSLSRFSSGEIMVDF